MAFAYTNQTNFRPFSYQEMLAPALMATQAQQEIENAYSELDSQAAAVGTLANEADDPVTYAKYRAFENNLRTQADTLATQGLTPASRKALINTKNYYASQITPIQNAITRRRALADEQRKALLSNPTLLYQRNFNNRSYDTSLDRFIDNPDYDYGSFYSGALLTQQVSKAASNLAKELSSYGKGKKLDSYTNTFLQHYGFTRNQVLEAINNPESPNASKVLNAIVDSTISSSGIPNWADKNTLSRAYNFAREGLWEAIGPDKISTFTDEGAVLAARARQAAANNPPTAPNLAVNPIPIFSQRELNTKQDTFLSNINQYKKYFYKDAEGNYRMNRAGWEEYNKKTTEVNKVNALSNINYTPFSKVQSVRTGDNRTPFRKLMDSIGVKFNGYGPNQSKAAGRKWENYMSNSPESDALKYDATKFTEYSYAVDEGTESQATMKNRMIEANRNKDKLYEVDFDPKTNTWKKTGETIKHSDLLSKDYVITSRRPSEIGTSSNSDMPSSTVLIRDKEGKVRRYLMPKGINPTAEDNRDIAIQNRLIAQRQLLNPNLSAEERAKWEDFYSENVNMQHLYESQLDYINKTKDQELNPYTY